MTGGGVEATDPGAARAARLKELIRQLAEIERAIRAESSERIDGVLDPSSASLILLRAAQEALVESESRYRRLVTRTSALVFEIAPDGTTLFTSDALANVTGYAPDEARGRNWWDLFFPGSRREEAGRLAERLRSEEVTGHEVVLTTRAGRRRPWR